MQKITAIVGKNGSGKTLYVEALRKQMASDRLRYIAFSDSYGPAVDKTYYLQLRWNQHDIDPETPNVGELLERAYQLAGDDTPERRQLQKHLYELFHMEPLLDKYIITLSSGELRKFQLTKTLFANPSLLIMENPFIGLDAETRDQLKDLLALLIEKHEIDIILVLSKTDDLPTSVSEVIEIRDTHVMPPCSREEFLFRQHDVPEHVLSNEKRDAILNLPYHDNDYHSDEVIKMQNVNIRYGERTILKDLNWTVHNGERWALSGQNGSGKSTLLSLVCADNPQSYACDITLFDHQRGTGESIWEIKRHIGYVSPEMHRSYQRDLPVVRIVASGLKDSVGLYVKPNSDEIAICKWWLDIFGMEGKYNHSFMKLSSGEQRLVLLARAFVKDPQLLILDEPLHGLDLWNRRLVKDVIETFCQRRNKTMVMVTHYEEELPNVITHKKYLTKQV
jgi:molybdate transport system ATP-binding protein